MQEVPHESRETPCYRNVSGYKPPLPPNSAFPLPHLPIMTSMDDTVFPCTVRIHYNPDDLVMTQHVNLPLRGLTFINFPSILRRLLIAEGLEIPDDRTFEIVYPDGRNGKVYHTVKQFLLDNAIVEVIVKREADTVYEDWEAAVDAYETMKRQCAEQLVALEARFTRANLALEATAKATAKGGSRRRCGRSRTPVRGRRTPSRRR